MGKTRPHDAAPRRGALPCGPPCKSRRAPATFIHRRSKKMFWGLRRAPRPSLPARPQPTRASAGTVRGHWRGLSPKCATGDPLTHEVALLRAAAGGGSPAPRVRGGHAFPYASPLAFSPETGLSFLHSSAHLRVHPSWLRAVVPAAMVVLACGSTPDGPPVTIDASAPDVETAPVDASASVADAARSCDGIRCDSPPATSCAGTATLTVFAPRGTCLDGVCSYASSEEACAPASCRNGVAELASTCSGGRCVPGATITCAFGCEGEQCAADPCAAVVCSTPPAADCLDAGRARTFPTVGSCSQGSCRYAPVVTVCGSSERCDGGRCVCVPEADRDLCVAAQATCGELTATDRCGRARTVASCGTCTELETCGANGVAGRCGVQAPLLCGRYRLVDRGTGDPNAECPGRACDGSGLVLDTQSGLFWSRFEYQPPWPQNQLHAQAVAHCASIGSRLPTRSELLGIAGASHCAPAIPSFFSWTSDFTAGGLAYLVAHPGFQTTADPLGVTSGVLCVRATP